MPVEIIAYRGIPGFPGYEVGDNGSVRSRRRGGYRPGVLARWRYKKLHRARNGYLRVRLLDKTYTVHRLVLLAFVGPCPPGMECLHRDGRRDNNSIHNLRWGTRSENERDKWNHGTIRRGRWGKKTPAEFVHDAAEREADDGD